MIRVVLIDDQMLVRRGIKALLDLSDDIRIVADASTADEGRCVVEREKPDVVLLDVRMPGKDGLELLRELHMADLSCPTILLTTFDDDAALFEGIKLRARGYLLKDVSLEQLASAIRTVASGQTVIKPVITERIIRGLEKYRDTDASRCMGIEALTTRELEILRLMAGGYSNREISEALGTAEGTIKNHASSILAKLEVRDRTRAVLKALEQGLI